MNLVPDGNTEIKLIIKHIDFLNSGVLGYLLDEHKS